MRRRHSPYFISFLAGLIGLTVLGFGVTRAFAASADLSWTYPTTNTDGSAVPASGAGAITSSKVEWGTCASTGAFGTKAGEATVPAPTKTYSVPNLSPGTWCFRAAVQNSYGSLSDWSGVVSKVIATPVPNPPTITTIAVIAGMQQTPVYSVTAANKLSTLMGFIDVGRPCAGPVLVTYRGKPFHEVARADVKWWGSTSLRVAAPCVTQA